MDRCNTYNYRVYGLNIKSQIRIDEFTLKRFTFFEDPDKLPLELYEK